MNPRLRKLNKRIAKGEHVTTQDIIDSYANKRHLQVSELRNLLAHDVKQIKTRKKM